MQLNDHLRECANIKRRCLKRLDRSAGGSEKAYISHILCKIFEPMSKARTNSSSRDPILDSDTPATWKTKGARKAGEREGQPGLSYYEREGR